MGDNITGICALCKKESELQLSHIIPKFIFRSLKKDSFTGRLRKVTEPNVPLQDGDKRAMLCKQCEGLFNRCETLFSNKVYRPFKENGFSGLTYEGNWLHYFITSVSWRNLVLDIEGFENLPDEKKKVSDKQLRILKSAEESMRLYLLEQQRGIDSIENHIFFFDTVESIVNGDDGLRLYSGVHGSSSGYTVINPAGLYVYANLTGIIIVSIIKKQKSERWKNTYVKITGGKINVPQKASSPVFGELSFLEKQREEYMKELSDNQREQIAAKIKKDPDGFKASGSYKRLLVDKQVK